MTLSSHLRQTSKYLPSCETFHVFSGFLCDHYAVTLRHCAMSRGVCLQAAGRSVLCCPLLPRTYLCADKRFVDSCNCQIVTRKISLSPRIPHNFFQPLPFSTVPLHVMKLLEAHACYYTMWFGGFLSICRKNCCPYIWRICTQHVARKHWLEATKLNGVCERNTKFSNFKLKTWI
jgi:hypothetical protein